MSRQGGGYGVWRKDTNGHNIHMTSLFFFQAEDGIRDVAVTGVQTCASSDLEHAGHQVLRAANVSEAEALVREVLPDLVLLDWMLPGPPGVNFARQLRADQRTKDIPIIIDRKSVV